MSKISMVEAIYDEMHKAGLNEEHTLFEDILMGCCYAAEHNGEPDVIDWLYENDNWPYRDRRTIAFRFFRFLSSGQIKGKASDFLRKVVAIGCTALNEDD